MPKISIIVPVYNVEPYLTTCLDSILNQTYTDFELILVDDGSTDRSGEICDEYKDLDHRVKVIHQANQGVSHTRNVGIGLASGLYITFVDSDDCVERDFLQKAFTQCITDNLDIYIAGYTVTVQNSAVVGDITRTRVASIPHSIFISDRCLFGEEKHILLEQEYTSVPWGKLYRKDFIKNTEFDETMCFGEDLKFVYTQLKRPCRLMAVPDLLYIYQKQPNGLSGRIDKKKLTGMKKTYLLLLKDCEETVDPGREVYADLVCRRLLKDYTGTIRRILYENSCIWKKYRYLKLLLNKRSIKEALKKADNKAKRFSYWPSYLLFRYYKKKIGRQILRHNT